MSNLPLAFILGLLGSLHCAVMCGPIMLSLPLQKTSYLKYGFQLLLYQFGRVLIYVCLGIIAGLIGSSLSAYTSLEALSFIIGSLMVTITLLHLSGKYFNKFQNFHYQLIKPISKLMGKLYGLPLWGLFAGMLNGLIPCGMVYLALATALNSSSISDAGSFMLLFGLGTTPLMLIISLSGVYLKRYVKFNSNKLVPWFTLFVGTLFILRAANLGVPFFSPDNNQHSPNKVEICR